MAVKPLDLTPEQQEAYDDMRASPGILFDAEGNVVFDGEAEATGATPYKTRAEFDAAQAELEAALDAYGRQRDDADVAAQDADQPRAASGEWTSGGGGVGGENGAHNAKHLSSLPKDMQDYHRAMQAPIAKHGYVEMGTAGSDDPVRDHLVHKMYKNLEKGTADRIHVYPRHDLGNNVWTHVTDGSVSAQGHTAAELDSHLSGSTSTRDFLAGGARSRKA